MKSAFSTWLSTNCLSTRGFFRRSPAIEKKMTATKLLALMSQALVDEPLMKFEVFRNGALEEGQQGGTGGGGEALLNPGLNSWNYSKAQLSAYCRSSWRYGLKPWEGCRWCAHDDPFRALRAFRPTQPALLPLRSACDTTRNKRFLVAVVQTTNSRYINTRM